MLPDFERADRIGEFWGNPITRTFAELLIDFEEDRTCGLRWSGCCRTPIAELLLGEFTQNPRRHKRTVGHPLDPPTTAFIRTRGRGELDGKAASSGVLREGPHRVSLRTSGPPNRRQTRRE